MADLQSGLPAPSSEDVALPDPKALAGFFAGGSQPQPNAAPQRDADPLAPVMSRIAQGETGGSKDPYHTLYGGGNFGFPQWEGRQGPAGVSHAAGKYQFEPATWNRAAKDYMAHGMPQPDFNNPADQDAVGRFWAMKVYAKNTGGRSLIEDSNADRVDYHALAGEWPSLAPKTHDGVGTQPLYKTAFGELTGPAAQLASEARLRLERADAAYEEATRRAESIRDIAIARERRQEALEAAPPKDAHAAWDGWSAVAGVLALLGGIAGRGHMVAGLNAMGGLLQGATEADQRQFDHNYKIWKEQTELGERAIGRLNQDANAIVNDASKSFAHQEALLRELSSIAQLPETLTHQQVQVQSQALDMAKKQADYIKAQNTETELRNAAREIIAKDHPDLANAPISTIPADLWNRAYGEAQRQRKGPAAGKEGETKEIEQINPDGSARTGAAYRVGTDWYWAGTNEKVTGGFNFKSVGRPRSAPAEAMEAFKRENPKATADEISHFNALFRVDADAASGAFGKNIVALNTLADHLPLFEKYARALDTGDVRVINRALQTLSEETGHTEITNFRLAQEFIADETVKVLVSGSGAGALADREALKARLMASMSQAQFGGVADVVRDFVHGKLGALRQGYSRGDADRGEYFNARLLTPDARRLFDTEGPGAAGGAAPPSVPIARPEVGGPIIKYDAQGNRVQ